METTADVVDLRPAPLPPRAAPTPDPARLTLRARDVMSAPVRTVDIEDSLAVAWSVMADGGVHHVVACSGRRCVGVVDDRTLFAHWPTAPYGIRTTPVRHLVRPRTTCVLPDTTIARVAEIMQAEDTDAVPVTRADGGLLGLVTSHDLTAAIARYQLGPVDPAVV